MLLPTTPLPLKVYVHAPSPQLCVSPQPSLVCFQVPTAKTQLQGLTGKAPMGSNVSTGPFPAQPCPGHPQTPQGADPHRPRYPAKKAALLGRMLLKVSPPCHGQGK